VNLWIFMNCKNHSDVNAVDRCTACAEAFCPDCLVEIHGQKYCGSCKVMAVKGQPILEEDPTVPCPEANEALQYAIVSIFCFGIFLAPAALVKASKARKLIAANPRLQGAGKVTAATVIAWCVLGLWIVGIFAKAAATSK
jgi:hypothetical protein